MARGTEKIFAAAGQAADTAAQATSRLVSAGKLKMDRMAVENRVRKVQQQLGALVYTQHKTGEMQEALRQHYLNELDRLHEELRRLAGTKTKGASVTATLCPSCGAEVQEGAMFCGGCRYELS